MSFRLHIALLHAAKSIVLLKVRGIPVIHFQSCVPVPAPVLAIAKASHPARSPRCRAQFSGGKVKLNAEILSQYDSSQSFRTVENTGGASASGELTDRRNKLAARTVPVRIAAGCREERYYFPATWCFPDISPGHRFNYSTANPVHPPREP
ncbi:hypothetical protein BZA05DRAFT_118667 [Tricharina praecox]|uniref:uncharacterized protein n=1 Tax=Tricharina praecox TaxID=43433 RepID=UPI00221FA87D|nr:uncharacterized protein BZA05DRAFT_118667 [Tricharina praecox]KAI5848043.1 hypothetical protein BZA05DRAFT_118667 [Tricharina praecox]